MRTSFAWSAVGIVGLFLVGIAAGSVTLPEVDVPVDAMAAGPQGADDAGSGGDAGESLLGALMVSSSSREYRGALTPPTSDRDWFRLAGAPDGPAFCARGSVASGVASRAALSAHSDRPYEVSGQIGANADVQLAFATPAGDGLWLGVEPVLSATSTDGGAKTKESGPAQYRFTLQAPTVQQLDPEAEGGTPGAKVLSGPCFAGRLAPSGGDVSDEWLLQTTSARRGTFSLAQAESLAVAMDLYAPNGPLRATIRSGDIVQVDLDVNGWWRLVVRPEGTTSAAALAAAAAEVRVAAVAVDAETSGSYIVGITTDDYWCRPSCL